MWHSAKVKARLRLWSDRYFWLQIRSEMIFHCEWLLSPLWLPQKVCQHTSTKSWYTRHLCLRDRGHNPAKSLYGKLRSECLATSVHMYASFCSTSGQQRWNTSPQRLQSALVSHWMKSNHDSVGFYSPYSQVRTREQPEIHLPLE